jgi:hypothetical protein
MNPPAPPVTIAIPGSVMIDRFHITATPNALFLRLDGIGVTDAGLMAVPVFSAMLTPDTAHGLIKALQDASNAQLTLSASTENPQ